MFSPLCVVTRGRWRYLILLHHAERNSMNCSFLIIHLKDKFCETWLQFSVKTFLSNFQCKSRQKKVLWIVLFSSEIFLPGISWMVGRETQCSSEHRAMPVLVDWQYKLSAWLSSFFTKLNSSWSEDLCRNGTRQPLLMSLWSSWGGWSLYRNSLLNLFHSPLLASEHISNLTISNCKNSFILKMSVSRIMFSFCKNIFWKFLTNPIIATSVRLYWKSGNVEAVYILLQE